MENRWNWTGYISRAVQAVAGFFTAALSIMGYYPLLPAFYASACLWKRRSFLLYVGIVAGMSYFMNYRSVLKYLLLLLVIGISVPFYRWANKRCSGVAAGLIAGICTMAMDFSETMLMWDNLSELLFGVSEGVLVFGFTVGLHYLLELGRSLQLAAFGFDEADRRERPDRPGRGVAADVTEERMHALVSAVGGLAEAVSAHDSDHAYEYRFTRTATAADIHESMENTDGMISGEAEETFAPETDCEGGEGVLYWHGENSAASHAWQQRMRENRMIITQQLSAMVELMRGWSMREHLLDDQSKLLIARILFETKERGFLVGDLHVLEDANRRRYVRANVAGKWSDGVPARQFVKALERAMHCSIRLERDAPTVFTREWVQITAYEDTFYYTLPGIAMHKKDDSVITGDNFTMFEMENGRHYIGLSDGMGSGLSANHESELVVDLLERLLLAGFNEETAISLLNSVMLLQGEDHSFSTLDLAALDLYSGELELYKVGAAASFVKHGERVRTVSTVSLPAGADPAMKPQPVTESMEGGDFLILVSDGVLGCFQTEEAAEYFARMAARIQTDNAGVLARNLLEQAMLVAGGQVKDDMTILVCGLWEKR